MRQTIITEENIKGFDSQLLLDPQRYYDIEDVILGMVAAGMPSRAKECALVLADKIEEQGNKIPKDLQIKYINLLKALKLLSLKNLDEKDQETFFREQILDLFKSDIVDVKEQVEAVFRSYFDAPEIIEDSRRLFLAGLEKNEETLGLRAIKVFITGEEKTVQPTIRNWLTDYNGSSHIDKELGKRGGYEQINYMTNSLNAKALDKPNRDLLLKIIQFYDWLRFDPLKYDFRLPGQPERKDEYIDVEKPAKYIPDDLISIIESLRIKKGAGQASQNYIFSEKHEAPVKFDASTPPLPPGGTLKKVEMGEITAQQPATRPSVASVLPSYNKPIPPAKVTAEILAAKMSQNRNQVLEVRNQDNNPSQLSLTQRGVGQIKQPSKAEEYLEKQIDQKLHNLEEKVKNQKKET